jgi:hypothetical protein
VNARWVKGSSAALLAAFVLACAPGEGGEAKTKKPPSQTLIIGIDVSKSFRGSYDDAILFASYYIYAHMRQLGGLKPPTGLFVGSVGGDKPGEPKSFHPINDFQNRTPQQIERDLRTWFPPRDAMTDFNVFFRQVAQLARERGLILAPMNVVLFSDGIPDVAGGVRLARNESPISRIDLGSLEFISRSVTVRLLYASPAIGDQWKHQIRHKRVRLWTQDAPVMVGWHRQVVAGRAPEHQDALWKWVQDNVDFRVRAGL